LKGLKLSSVDYTQGFTRMTVILAIAVILGWFLTASNADELAANAWMLLILPGIGVAYFVLKGRVAKIPTLEEESEE